jgi:hypothetical protein
VGGSIKERGFVFFQHKTVTGQFFQFKQGKIPSRLKNNVML